MKTTLSLKENHMFRRLYAKGKNAATPYLALYVRKNGRGYNRLGLTVGAKLGKAVRRNRVRRRIRESYRVNEDKFLTGYDIVVVARSRAVNASYREIQRSLLRLADKLGILSGGNGGTGQ